ncbi:MAG: hypothetical protein KC910_02355 [Candidatus Eremiobacteraeota bacterium]|nr:hypothetical protein [Candidatus Eremiobacteraeota bacterium]
MKSYATGTLPPTIQSIFESPPGTTFGQIAQRAVFELERIASPEVQSEAGAYLLRFLQGRGDSYQQDFVEQALQVMEKFPHFPRPRAKVALRALTKLAAA